jgi:hypothetical protein
LEEGEAVRAAVDLPVDEDDLTLRRDAFTEVGFSAFDRSARAFRFGAFTAPPDPAIVFLADLDLRFWIAIGDILCCDSIMRCHWQKPATCGAQRDHGG